MSKPYADGYKVLRYIPSSPEDVNALLDLAEERNHGVIFLNRVSDIGQPVDVMVLPALQDKLKEAMLKRGVEASIIVENTGKSDRKGTRYSISEDSKSNTNVQIHLNNIKNSNNNNELDSFERLSDIMGYNDKIIKMENPSVEATVTKFQFLFSSDKLTEHTMPIYLAEKMTVPNHSCSEIATNFSHSKKLKQSYSFYFEEFLPFVTSMRIPNCKVPMKCDLEELNFSFSEEKMILGSRNDNINVTHSCETTFSVNNSVKVPPYKCVEIHVHVNWLRRLQVPFSAEITLTAGDNGDRSPENCKKSLSFVEQALRGCNFMGRVLRTTPDENGVVISTKGTFTGDYAIGTVFSVQDALDPIMVDNQEQEQQSGFKDGCVYQIVNVSGNKALELFGGDKNDAAKVVTLDKNHRETQHWKAVSKGNGFLLQSVLQEEKLIKVLTTDSVQNKVLHSYHNEGDLLQKWITQKIGRDKYLIICCANEKCLTSQGNGLSVATEAICGPAECQLWKILEL